MGFDRAAVQRDGHFTQAGSSAAFRDARVAGREAATELADKAPGLVTHKPVNQAARAAWLLPDPTATLPREPSQSFDRCNSQRALNTNCTVLVSLPPIVTVCVDVPSFSCQASIV